MDKKSLSVAFGDSLKEESISCIGDLVEVGLDAITADGILKDIPLISTAVAIYKIRDSILERYNMKKLIAFLNEINNGIADEQKREKYQQKFQNNEKFRNQEIEYLLILINRYISYEKPVILAKLYCAYLDERITWREMVAYSETIDLLLTGDIDVLKQQDVAKEISILNRTLGNESFLRLVSVGLLCEKFDKSGLVEDGQGGYAMTWNALQKSQKEEKTYVFTEYGAKLVKILN